jgi:hypothetical protein
MAICSNCKTEGPRVRSRWTEKNVQLPDECPNCAPESFGKVTDPSDKKPWMGWEAHPNEYEKKYDKDGLIYERKPEYRAEQEQRLMQATEEERLAQERAVEKKRKERRTTPMDSAELAAALRRAEEVASFIIVAAAQGRDVN